MTIHVKQEEMKQKLQSVKEFSAFQILQERLLKKKVIEVEEFERKRIAQNIHDEVGSILAAIKYQVLSLQEAGKKNIAELDFQSIFYLLDEGVKNQYSIIDELISNFDQGESLARAVEKKLKLTFSENGVKWDISFMVDENVFSIHQKTHLYRIFLELITNTLKHAHGVTFILIQVKDTNPIEIIYSDDGKNAKVAMCSHGQGLDNIKFRIDQMRGSIQKLKIHQGFYLSFIVPKDDEKNISLPY